VLWLYEMLLLMRKSLELFWPLAAKQLQVAGQQAPGIGVVTLAIPNSSAY
jgi:hypothetical protein